MRTIKAGYWISALALFVAIAAGGHAATQPALPDVVPVNSGENPYRVIRNWGNTPEGRPWGAANGVAIDIDGMSVWTVDRCGIRRGCVGMDVDPVQKFDSEGNFVTSFGRGMFVWPHGLHVDAEGNVWVADARRPNDEERTMWPDEQMKGSVVVKFSPEGEVLMVLGEYGVAGDPPERLTDPTNVITDPENGDIYVAESHTDVTDPNLVGRISVFDRDGNFLRSIGRMGTGPGEFRTPHAMVFDSQGRLIVADRHNHRIQILTKEGAYIGEYHDFSRVSGLAIDAEDNIYAADSESDPPRHPGWLKGIRIGNLSDGVVRYFVPPHATDAPEGAMGEGIAIDAEGNLYTAEATVTGITKYVRE